MIPRLSAQARKSIADIVRRRAQSLLIVLAILLPVAGLTAASAADDELSAAYAFSVGIGGTHPDVTIVTDKVTPAMLAAVARAGNVGSAQPATVLSTRWDVAQAPGYVDFTIVGYPDPRHVPLTPYQLISGRYPGDGEIVMEYGDSGLQHVGVGGMDRLGGAQFGAEGDVRPR